MSKTLALSFMVGATLSREYFSVFDNAKKRINKLGTAFDAHDKKLQAANGVIKYKERLQMLKQKQDQAGGSNKKLADGIKVTERLYKQAKSSAKSYGVEIGSVIQQQKKLSAETDRLKGKLARLNQAQSRKDKAGQKLQNMRGQMLGAAGTVYAGARVIGETMTFQHELRMFGNTGGLTNDELSIVRGQLKETALQVNQDQSTLLGGVDFLVGKGLSTDQATGAIFEIGKAATATGASLQELSQAGFAVIDNMGISESELKDAFNIMAATGKAGGFELRDMAQYFPQLTAQAKSLGVVGKEGLATLGSSLQIAMKGAGDPSQAANNFNNFLGKLTAPDTVKRFEKMGVDIKQVFQTAMAEGKDPVIEMIKLTEQLTDGDKFKIGELFGDMQVINFLNPMLSNLKEFEEIRRNSLNSDGILDQDFANMMSTGTEQVKLFTIGLRSIGDGLAMSVLPSMTPFISMLGQAVGWVAKGVEKYPALGKVIVGVAVGFTVFATGLAIATAATWAFNTALLANPITWVIGGIILGAALIIAFWKPITNFFKGLWQQVKTAFNGGIVGIGKLIINWSPYGLFYKAMSKVLNWFGFDLPSNFTEFGGNLISSFVGGAKNVFSSVTGFFNGLWTDIKGMFDGSILGISETILNWSPVGLFYKAFESVFSWFGVELPSTFTEFGGGLIDGISSGLTNMIPDLMNKVSSIGSSITSWFNDTFGFSIFSDKPQKLELKVTSEMPPATSKVNTDKVNQALRASATVKQQNDIHVVVNNPTSNVDVANGVADGMARQGGSVPFSDPVYD